MAMIQGIDGSALLAAFRQGRGDRAADDKAKAAKAETATWNGLVAQAMGVQPSGGGVAGNFAPSQPQTPPVAPGSTFDQAFSPQAMGAIQSGSPTASTAPAAPPQGPRQIDPNILQKMAILRPEQAGQLATTLKTLDETRLKARAAVNDASGAAAHYIQQGATPQERQQRFMNAAAHLRENGVPEEGIQRLGSDLSDTALQAYQGMAIDFDKIIDNELAEREFRMGKQVPVTAGGSVASIRPQMDASGNVTGTTQEYIIGGPGGQAQQAGGVSEGATATNPQTGEKIIYQGGQWVPAGGGASNGTGGFP